MLAEIISGLALLLQGLWLGATFWGVLACLGLLFAIWKTIRFALTSDPVESERIHPADEKGRGEPFAYWVLGVLTILGLCLRLYGRGALPYWWDELLAVWMAQSDVSVMLQSLFTPAAPASDFTPPLFYVLLHGWMNFFGDSESSTRILTALFSTLSIPVAGLLGRRLFSWREGLTVAFLLCISPPEIFYAQQVRCYALLGLLALGAVYFADKAFRTGRLRDDVSLAVLGTLFLYTHYVATWLWLGIGMATIMACGLEWFQGSSVRSVFPNGWRVGTVAAGFVLSAFCPLFFPVLLKDMHGLWGFWVAGILVAVMLVSRPWPASVGHDRRRFLFLIGAFALPPILLSFWMVPSGVIQVIGGAGTRIPGSYGYPEFARMLAEFSGPQAVLDIWMLGLGFFLVLVGLYRSCVFRPRQAVLLIGWAALPMTMAMVVQNPSMNLIRYLIATAPAVLLLVSVAVCAACDGIAMVLAPFTRYVSRKLASVAGMAAPIILGAALLGYPAYTAMPLPTTRANIEKYPVAATKLNQESSFFLLSESHNLVRALSWYLQRQGRSSVTILPNSPRLGVVNTFLDGSLWHQDAMASLELGDAVKQQGDFGEITLFIKQPSLENKAVEPASSSTQGETIILEGSGLRRGLLEGKDIAYAGGNSGGLVPLFKKEGGLGVYRLSHDQEWAGRVVLGLRGIVVGKGSYIQVRFRVLGESDWFAAVTLKEEGLMSLLQDTQQEILSSAAARGEEVEVELKHPIAPGQIEVEISLQDDGSGVIYSSNVVLRSLSIRSKQ
jgi:hypothetical protein